jgi:hypothetical protein
MNTPIGLEREDPRINASSFEKARNRDKELGVTLRGELMMIG